MSKIDDLVEELLSPIDDILDHVDDLERENDELRRKIYELEHMDNDEKSVEECDCNAYSVSPKLIALDIIEKIDDFRMRVPESLEEATDFWCDSDLAAWRLCVSEILDIDVQSDKEMWEILRALEDKKIISSGYTKKGWVFWIIA
jgi:hypothetical protein